MFKRKKRADAALAAQIRAVGEQLSRANANAAQCADPLLFESTVYEIKYLQTRYAYLMGLARDCGLQSTWDGGKGGRKRGGLWKKSSLG